MADKIVVLDGGLVQQFGAPIELYQRPVNLFVAGFIGSPKMNLLSATIDEIVPGAIRVSSRDLASIAIPCNSAGFAIGDTITIGIRPHALEVDESGPLIGYVVLTERLGNETNVSFSLPSGQTVLAVLDGDRKIENRRAISFAFDPASAILFDGDGTALY